MASRAADVVACADLGDAVIHRRGQRRERIVDVVGRRRRREFRADRAPRSDARRRPRATPSKCVASIPHARRSRRRASSATRSAFPSCGVVVRANSSTKINSRGASRDKISFSARPRAQTTRAGRRRAPSRPNAEPSDLVEEPDARARRRHRQTERRAEREESARQQADALAAHVRSGQHGGVVQLEIERRERAARGRELRFEREKARLLEREHRSRCSRSAGTHS